MKTRTITDTQAARRATPKNPLALWRLVVGTLGLLGVLAGCERPRTQILVRITATPATWRQMRSVRVTVQRQTLGAPPILDARCFSVSEDRANEVGLTPRDPDDPSAVRITVRAYAEPCDDAGAPREELLTQVAELRFEKERTLLVLMPFTVQCPRDGVCTPPPAGCLRGSTCRALNDQETRDCVCVERPLVREYTPADVADANDLGASARDVADGGVAPRPCEGMTCVASIVSSQNATCALRRDGAITCWGVNNELGFTETAPTLRGAPTNVAHLAIGPSHACAVLSSGQVTCWGRNNRGQLGDGSTGNSVAPVMVTGISDATQVAVGPSHSCARRRTGQVLCWGSNDAGEAGVGPPMGDLRQPVLVLDLNDAEQVVAGATFTCARRTGGTVVCWGAGAEGQIGNGTNAGRSRIEPVQPVVGLSEVEQIAAGSGPMSATVCAVRRGGGVSCWGAGAGGLLAERGTTENRNVATPVVGLTNATSIAVGRAHVCARRTDGSVSCWGTNGTGQLGNGAAEDMSLPVTVSGVTNATAVSAGANHTCALREDGTVLCWGGNEARQLGNGQSRARTTPVQVSAFCAPGFGSCDGACRDLANDAVYCGRCDNPCSTGQSCRAGLCVACPLGQRMCADGCRNIVNDPMNCGDCGVRCGSGQECEIQDDGTGRCANVSPNTRIRALVAAHAATCALRRTGTLWCWGGAGSALLGIGSTIPTMLPDLPDVVDVSLGRSHACAVRASGRVVCWGENGFGQLGDGMTDNRRMPVAVLGLLDARQVVVGASHSCAVRRTGQVVCWGEGGLGQLGDDIAVNSSYPVPVTPTSCATSVTQRAATPAESRASLRSRWGCRGSGGDRRCRGAAGCG